MPKRAIFVGIFLGLGAAGCAATDANAECDRGSDCASGACNDGQCVVATGGTAGSGGSAGSSAGSAGMAGSAGSAAGSGGSAGAAGSSGSGGGSGLCQPNHDGSIERSEAPLQAGLNAKFMVALSAPVDTMGTQNPDGSRSWNLAQALAGDHLALVETQPLAGKWFAAKYPSATYASVLSDTEDLLGVFEVTSATLLLHGVVSPQDGLQKTELHYDPPITVLAFPLQEGKTWQTTSTVTGFAQGVIANYTEKYEYAVDAHGELQTPFGTFPVLRTRSTLTRTVGLITTTLRSFLFPSECFGVVASITSKTNEPNTEFSQAGEVRRLAP
jgi:hypothetical protein